MKKIGLPLLMMFLVLSCTQEQVDQELDLQTSVSNRDNNVSVCHVDEYGNWFVINIDENALAAHMRHGDVHLVDADGDGYVEAENECVPGGDCDDLNPSVNPGVEEVCGDGIDNNCDGQVDEGCEQVSCQWANLELYGPYISVRNASDVGLLGYVLERAEGLPSGVQIIYDFNIPGEWEFIVFNEIHDEIGPTLTECDFTLLCGSPGGCQFGFAISEEDAMLLIQEIESWSLRPLSGKTETIQLQKLSRK